MKAGNKGFFAKLFPNLALKKKKTMALGEFFMAHHNEVGKVRMKSGLTVSGLMTPRFDVHGRFLFVTVAGAIFYPAFPSEIESVTLRSASGDSVYGF